MNFQNFALTIRPLTGADLEAIAPGSSQSIKEQIARACITSSAPPLPQELPEGLIDAVSVKLQEIDPQADTTLSLTCPACSTPFQAPLDVEAFFFQEMTSRQGQLEEEINWIALNYHWSEEAILLLSAAKRKRYVELINKTVSGANV